MLFDSIMRLNSIDSAVPSDEEQKRKPVVVLHNLFELVLGKEAAKVL